MPVSLKIRSSSAFKPVPPSLYVPISVPVSTTSRKPSAARAATMATAASAGTLVTSSRTSGTMQ